MTYTGNHLITRGTGGTAVSYRFDARGNCTNVGTASAPRFLEYDPDNNLIAAHAGPTNWSFRYNAQNQMAWSQLKVNGTVADERCYVYDGLDCIAEVTPSGTLLREFIRNGAIGSIVADKIYNDPTVPSEYRNTTLYYHYNHRGDVVSVSDGSGTHIWQSDYDAFGQPLPVKSASGAFAPRYTFSTKRYFPELGTYYYGYRWFLPELCRWMQKDPIRLRGMSINYYSFCLSTPLYFCDMFGLANEPPRVQRGLIVVGSSTTAGSNPQSLALKAVAVYQKSSSSAAQHTRETLAEVNAEKFREHSIVTDVVKEPSASQIDNIMRDPSKRPDIFVFYGHSDATSFQINTDETYGYDQLPNGCFSLLVMESCYSAQSPWYEKKLGPDGVFAGNIGLSSPWFTLWSQRAIEMYLLLGSHGDRYGTPTDDSNNLPVGCPL